MTKKKTDSKVRFVWQKQENLFEKVEEKLFEKNLENIENEYPQEDDFEDWEGQPGEPGVEQNRHPFLFTSDNAAIPMGEYFPNPKLYNFWVGYTDFPITDDIIDVIDNTSGVETFERFTPYRMRIAVGKLFKPGEVLTDLEKNVRQYLDKGRQ